MPDLAWVRVCARVSKNSGTSGMWHCYCYSLVSWPEAIGHKKTHCLTGSALRSALCCLFPSSVSLFRPLPSMSKSFRARLVHFGSVKIGTQQWKKNRVECKTAHRHLGSLTLRRWRGSVGLWSIKKRRGMLRVALVRETLMGRVKRLRKDFLG